MAVFSTNQVRQLFVAKSYSASQVTAASAIGALSVDKDMDGDLYFNYKGPSTVLRSDLIDKTKLVLAKATDSSNMRRGLKKYRVVLDSTVNSGNPVAGQDYLLRVHFQEWVSLSPENQYFKYGIVHAITGMTADTFYKTLQSSLIQNFKSELTPLLNFGIEGTLGGITFINNNPNYQLVISAATTAASATLVSNVVTIVPKTGGTIADINAALVTAGVTDLYAISQTTYATATQQALTAVAVVLEEIEQPWILGRYESAPLKFKVLTDSITVSGDSLLWGVVTEPAATSFVENGKKIADLEYFLAGERGDTYRNIGFPRVITTAYLVDATVPYHVLDITYFYKGVNEEVQESQKGITIIASDKAVLNSIIGAINTAISTTIATL